MKEIEVKCMPRDLVDNFEVDLALLKEAGDIIRVSVIGLDATKYDVHGHEDSVIASAVLPRAAVAESSDDEV